MLSYLLWLAVLCLSAWLALTTVKALALLGALAWFIHHYRRRKSPS